MELQITGKNMDVSPEVRQYIERKLDRIDRHLNKVIEYKVEIAEQKTKSPQQRFVVQATVDSNGTLLRSQERAASLFAAVDKVSEVMDRQIERYKGKTYYKRGRGNTSPKNEASVGADVYDDEEIDEAAGKLVKIKRFVVKPMSRDEAVQQMELLGHDFFLFYDSDDQGLNLVYRRRDGDYGLIRPELG